MSGRDKREGKELRGLKSVSWLRVHPGQSRSRPATPAGVATLRFLKMLLLGRERSAYAGCALALLVELPEAPPIAAPHLRLLTSTYHNTVSHGGDVLLPALKHGWSPAQMLRSALVSLEALLLDAAVADPHAGLVQRSWLSDLLRVASHDYRAQAEARARIHAPLSAPNATARDLFYLLASF